MKKGLRYILLIILLAVASGAASQAYVIDSVCLGVERHYRIDGETGSIYRWTVTDPQGAIIPLPETADTVTITWNMGAGEFILSVVQTSIYGCDTLELGSIQVFELPLVNAGSNMTICADGTVLLAEASAANYSSLLWTTSGDGNFDNNFILHPTYIPGPGDLLAGSVVLTITATGTGREGACPPAESSITAMLVPVISPVIVIEGAPTTICAGSTVNFTSNVSGEGSTPAYQWRVNDIPVTGASSATWSSSSLVNNDVVRCVLTSSESCANPATATSNEVIITVTPFIVPTIVITGNPTTICTGMTVNFTSVVSGEGLNPSYQWMMNGLQVTGANSAIWSSSTLADNDVVSCVLTSSETCANPSTANSNEISITVTPFILPTIVITGNPTTICAGSMVNFTSVVTGQGSTPVYQWFVNSIPVAGASSTSYSSSTLANNDAVSCELTSNETCANPVTAISNEIIITVNPVTVPTIVIGADHNPICAGTLVTFTSVVSNQGSNPIYQWRKNGIVVGENSPTYTDNILENNDAISCTLFSDESCANPSAVTSIPIIMTVNPIVNPTITITADHNPVCPGTLVTFTTSVTNEGISPFYRWRKNGIIVGANSPSYADNTILNNDVISCTLISSEACADPDSVTSNTVMMVSPPLTPTIVIAADKNPICQGTLVTFTAAITNGGLSPIYQWKKNGINVGTSDSVYLDSALANNDIIACRLWSSERCIDSVYVTSNIIEMIVNPPLVPAISINYDHNPSCSGALVTFTSSAVNSGFNPVYRWRKNGTEVGTNNPIYTDSTIVNNDLITCTLFSSETCAKPDSAVSNSIVMVVSPAMTALINEHTDILCYGDPNGSASVTVTGGIPDYNYLWSAVPVQTTQIATNLTPGIYNVTVTDLIGCTAVDSIVIAGPAQPLTVIATSTDVNCVDANNGMAMAMASGGTPGYTYRWNDPMLQVNDTAINLVPGTYIVIVTDTNQCTETATVGISEPVTREPKITISIDNEPVCRKSLVHFTSNVVYPGSNPLYQWTKNGVNVGTNDSVYSDSTLTNSDVINCIFTSSEPCAIPATKISNGIQINVKEPPIAAFSINEIPDDIIGNIQLDNNSSGAASYFWDFGNGQNSNEENPTVSYFRDGNFLIKLIAYSVDFCTDTATNKFQLDFYGLYIPNAFAPQSSSSPANVFKPVGTNLKQYRIEVYDSWGNLMWESNALDSEGSPSEAWDGKYRQELMPQGAYMWKVNAIFNDNTIWQGCDIGKGRGKTIGTVTLIR